MGVWAAPYINISQGTLIMQGIPISQMQVLCSVIFKIQWQFQDYREPKRQKPPLWSALFSDFFPKSKTWAAQQHPHGFVLLWNTQTSGTKCRPAEIKKPFQEKPWSAAGEPRGEVGTPKLGPFVPSSSKGAAQVWASPSCSSRGRGFS